MTTFLLKLLHSVNMTQVLQIINDFGWKSNDPTRQVFYYLAIFENQTFCLDTGGWTLVLQMHAMEAVKNI